MIGRNIELLKSGIAAASESWKPLTERGLALGTDPVSGLAKTTGNERPMLSGMIAGCALEVHIVSDMVHYAHTEITAKPKSGIDAKIGVHPNPGGIFGYLRQWLGQDIQIGDEAFDPAYLITGKPETAPASLLVPSVRELVTSLGAKLAGFTYAEDRVAVVLHGVETDASVLGAAIDLAAAGASWAG
jgi:hypothetical protein